MNIFFFMHRLLVCSNMSFFWSQGNHIHYMDISTLHPQIVSVSSVLFQSQGNHMHNMDIAFLGLHLSQTVVTCITWKSSSFMHRLFMVFRAPFAVTKQSHDSHGNFLPMCTDCVCPQGYLLSHKEVTCITWIFLSFVHSLLICPQLFLLS